MLKHHHFEVDNTGQCIAATGEAAPENLLQRCEELTAENMREIYEAGRWQNSYTNVIGYCPESKMHELAEPGLLICASSDPNLEELQGFIKVVNAGRGVGFVMELQVAAQNQRQGLGRALMTEATEACVKRFESRRMQLCVQRNNEKAQQFYPKLGFTVERSASNFLIYGRRIK